MKVKVWNDNIHPYKEKFRNVNIEIPAGKHIWMEQDEALIFKGTFSPILVDVDGQKDPKGYKMIRIQDPKEPDRAVLPKPSADGRFVCQFDGASFPSADALNKYIKDNHSDKVVIDEEAEIALKAKRGPGRPAKPKPLESSPKNVFIPQN